MALFLWKKMVNVDDGGVTTPLSLSPKIAKKPARLFPGVVPKGDRKTQGQEKTV